MKAYKEKLREMHIEASCQVIHCALEKRPNEDNQLDIEVRYGGKRYGGYLPPLR